MKYTVIGSIVWVLLACPAAHARHLPSPGELTQRGVTFYVPFEDSADAHYAHGERRFIEKVDLNFCEGKVGRALDVLSVQTPRNRTQLIYGLLGNLYGDQGTIAFWVKPHWRAGDPNIYAHSGGSGPVICGIAAEEVRSFFSLWFRHHLCRWHLYRRDSGPDGRRYRAGTFTAEPVKTWQADQWHHMLTTWHRDRGVRLYMDGKRLYDTWGKKHGPFRPYTPCALAVGAIAPFGGSHYWAQAPGLAFDELVLMNRPVDDADVRALMEARYIDLAKRGPEPLGATFQAERRRRWGLEPDANRPTIRATGPTAWVRWQALEVAQYDVDYKHRQHLADGHLDTAMHLTESGLDFAREVCLRLPRSQKANYLQVWGKPAADSAVRLPSGPVRLSSAAPGSDVVRTSFAEMSCPDVLRLWFGKASLVREVTAFHVTCGASAPMVTAIGQPLAAEPSDALQQALKPLRLRYADADDARFLVAGTLSPRAVPPIHRQANQPLGVATRPAAEDRACAGVRLDLAVRGLQPNQVFRVRLVHPEDGRRVYLDADVQIAGRADAVRRLVLDPMGPGLVYRRGRPVVAQVASSHAWTVDPVRSSLVLFYTAVPDAARAYALRELYAANDEFTGRQSKTRYTLRGETPETNLMKQWFERILHVDPQQRVVRNLYHWCGYAPYPETDFRKRFWRPDCAGAPEWAWVMRECIHQASRHILWWIDHRQDPETGYIMGDGNQFNDVTKLWTKYIYLPLLTDDHKILDAIDRYLACHLKHGRYKDGYSSHLTDMTHSVEEACYITGANAFLHDYRPIDIGRLRDTAKNLKFWLGVNQLGYTHFKSNYFTATKMKTDGVFGWDVPDCRSATTPAGYLVLATGDADTRRRMLALGDAWVAASKRTHKDKPDGVPPLGVQWPTGRLRWGWYGPLCRVFEHLLWCYHQTDDPKYLEPIEATLRFAAADKTPGRMPDVTLAVYTSQMYLGRAFLQWRQLTGKRTYDAFFDTMYRATLARTDPRVCPVRGLPLWEVPQCLDWVIHRDKRRLVEALKFTAINIERAFDASTHMDPDTDRVYPAGRFILTTVALGGRALGDRSSMPYPLATAIRWYDTGTDFASLVLDNTTERVRFLAYSFTKDARRVAFKALRLRPGTYRMTVGPDRDNDDRPDAVTETRTVTIPPGPRRPKIVIEVSSRVTTVVEMAKP